jgi:methylmalonyl-CoA mutase N-terminal domain/subunit
VDAEVEHAQLRALETLKQDRDSERLDTALAALRGAAEGDENVLPRMLEAVRAYGTVGEISQALVPVFGTYREVSVI